MKNTSAKPVLVWDLVLRTCHWSIAAIIIINAFIIDDGKRIHEWLGYAVLLIIAIRMIWGFIGTPHARYADFIPSFASLRTYIAALLKSRAPRYIGHNPLGVVMMIALIFTTIACCITGWMQTLDRFWGEEWLQNIHELTSDFILYLAALHVFAAIFESVRHKENLIKSMITGLKSPATNDDIDYVN